MGAIYEEEMPLPPMERLQRDPTQEMSMDDDDFDTPSSTSDFQGFFRTIRLVLRTFTSLGAIMALASSAIMFNEGLTATRTGESSKDVFEDLVTAVLCVYSALTCFLVFLVEIECHCIVTSFPLLSWWVLRGFFLSFVALQNLHLGSILSTDSKIVLLERVASGLLFLCGCTYVLLGFCGCSIRERMYARQEVDALKNAEICATMEAINRKYEDIGDDENL